MAQDGPPSDAVGPPPGGPYVLRPEWQRRGPQPATQMLERDLTLQPKFSLDQCVPGPHYQPPEAATIPKLSQPALDETDLPALQNHIVESPANILVPPRREPAEQEDGTAQSGAADGAIAQNEAAGKGWQFKRTGAQIGSSEGGVGVTDERGIREYIASGYTRRNPNGFRNPDGSWNTITRDDDFGGKWDEHAEIVGGQAERDLFSASVAEGRFGGTSDTFAGSGTILGASGKASGQFSFTQEGTDGVSPGLRASGGAQAQGALARGQVGTRGNLAEESQTLATGQASGSAVSGKAEAKGELILTAEQATLGGKLGAEVNLIEGKIEGDLHITPRRVVNGGVDLYNWMFDDDVPELLGENWDVGIMVGGEVSGQVGAQAGAEARAGYEDGKLRAEAGAKIGLGVGAGVKGRVGLVGVDRIVSGARRLGSAAWDGAAAGASAVGGSIRSGWNWLWSD